MNEHPQTTDKAKSSDLEDARRRKGSKQKLKMLRTVNKCLEIGLIFWHEVDKEIGHGMWNFELFPKYRSHCIQLQGN
jgi:hypothetical protein